MELADWIARWWPVIVGFVTVVALAVRLQTRLVSIDDRLSALEEKWEGRVRTCPVAEAVRHGDAQIEKVWESANKLSQRVSHIEGRMNNK